MSDPASRHKRPRDRGDSAVAPSSASAPRSAGAASSCSAVAKSTSERHTDSLAHLAAAYAAVDGYALAREEKAAQRAAGVFRDGIQYGEVSAASFARCLEWVTPVAGEVFYDLGSGTGKAVLTAAALHPLAAAYGIEIQPRLHEAALAARRAFEAIEGASLRAGRVTLQCGDAFAEDAAWPETADLVFCTTTCISPVYLPFTCLYLPYISPTSPQGLLHDHVLHAGAARGARARRRAAARGRAAHRDHAAFREPAAHLAP